MTFEEKDKRLFALAKRWTLAQAELIIAQARQDSDAILLAVKKIRAIEIAQKNIHRLM